MPKFLCLCNKTIWTGEIPCPYESRFLSDEGALRFHGETDWLDLYLSTSIATLCPRCRRAHLWIHGTDAPALIYRPCTEADFESATPLTRPDEDDPSTWAKLFGRSFAGTQEPIHDDSPPRSHLVCACGADIPVADAPWSRRWRFMRDVELERWGDTLDADAFRDACAVAILCPRCKRLHAFMTGRPSFRYAPESPRDWPTCDEVDRDPGLWDVYYGADSSSGE